MMMSSADLFFDRFYELVILAGPGPQRPERLDKALNPAAL
jgi:hypothetical protein